MRWSLLLVLFGALLSAVPCGGQGDVLRTTVHVMSREEYVALRQGFNPESGVVESSVIENTQILTVQGGTGDTVRLVLESGLENNINQSIYEVSLGTVTYTLGCYASAKTPMNVVKSLIRSLFVVENSGKRVRNELLRRLTESQASLNITDINNQTASSPPSGGQQRKRGLGYQQTTIHFDDALNLYASGERVDFLNQEAELLEDVMAGLGAMGKGEGRGKRSYVREDAALDPASFLFFVYIPSKGRYVWKKGSEITPFQRLSAKSVRRIRERESRKRSYGPSQNPSGNIISVDVSDAYGASCNSRFSGMNALGVGGDEFSECKPIKVGVPRQRIRDLITAVNFLSDEVLNLVARQGQTEELLGQLRNMIENQQAQIEEIARMNQILIEANFQTQIRLDTISQTLEEFAGVAANLAATDRKLASDMEAMNYINNINFDITNRRLIGGLSAADRLIGRLQENIRRLEDRAAASIERTYIQGVLNQAMSEAAMMKNLRRVMFEGRLELAKYVTVAEANTAAQNQFMRGMNNQLSYNSRIDAKQNEFLRDVTRHLYGSGGIPFNFWVVLKSMEKEYGGQLIPVIRNGTGNPPVDMNRYTMVDGMDLSYSYIDTDVCQLTDSQRQRMEQNITTIANRHAVFPLLVPHARNPMYVRYTGNVLDFPFVHLSGAIRFLIQVVFVGSAQNATSGEVEEHRYILLSTRAQPFAPLLVPDTPTARAISNRTSCALVGMDPSRDRYVTRDGDPLQMYCNIGPFPYVLGLDGNGRFVTATGTSVGTDPALTVQIRKHSTDVFASRTNFLERVPFDQETELSIYRLSGDASSYLRRAPSGVEPLTFTASEFSGGSIPGANGTVFVASYIRLIPDRYPFPNLNDTGVPEQILSESGFNSTYNNRKILKRSVEEGDEEPRLQAKVTQLREEEHAERRSRRKRSQIPQATMDECYSGVTPMATPYGTYRALEGERKERIDTCLAKPGCTHVTFKAPQGFNGFTGVNFDGTRKEFNMGGSVRNEREYSTSDFPLNSAVFPFSMTARMKLDFDYRAPPTGSEKVANCLRYDMMCSWIYPARGKKSDAFATQNSCLSETSLLTKTSAGRTAWCRDAGEASGLVGNPSWTDPGDKAVSDLWSHNYADVNANEFLLCPDRNTNTKFQMPCLMKGAWPWMDYDRVKAEVVALGISPNILCNWLMVGTDQISNYPTFNHMRDFNPTTDMSLFEMASLPASAYSLNEGDTYCSACLPGFGQAVLVEGNNGKYIIDGWVPLLDGSCPRATLPDVPIEKHYNISRDSNEDAETWPDFLDHAVFGTREHNLTWSRTRSPTFPSNPTNNMGSVDAAWWDACIPSEPNLVNGGSTQVYPNIEFPYLLEEGDLGPATYWTYKVQMNGILPSCKTLTKTECQSQARTGVNGHCKLVVAADQPPSSRTAGLVQECVPAIDGPEGCANITSIDDCIDHEIDGNKACQWSIGRKVCERVTVDGIESTSGRSYIMPCSFRDPQVLPRCVHDDRCYQKTIDQRFFSCERVQDLPFVVRDDLNYVGDIDQAEALALVEAMGLANASCNAANVECHFRTQNHDLRIYYLLNKALPEEVLECESYIFDSTCGHRSLFYDPNWNRTSHGTFYKTAGLVPRCIEFEGACLHNCETFGKDADRCLFTPYCFGNSETFECHQDSNLERQKVCGSLEVRRTNATVQCIKIGNECAYLSPSRFLDGSGSVFLNDSSTRNEVLDQMTRTECALIGGAASGDVSLTANSSRFDGVTLPRTLSNLCTAVASQEGLFCESYPLVGSCNQEDACDEYTDLMEHFDRIVGEAFCSHDNVLDCVLFTPDGRNFPCSFVSLHGTPFGYCTHLDEAIEQEASDPNYIKVLNQNNYYKSVYETGKQINVTADILDDIGLSLCDVFFGPEKLEGCVADPLGESDASLRISVLDAVWFPCPDPEMIPTGYGCCSPDGCKTWIPNPYHPKNVQQHHLTTICPDKVIKRDTIIAMACKRRSTGITNPQDEVEDLSTYYSCEYFVPPEAIHMFPIIDAEERVSEWVVMNDGSEKTMIPLQIFPVNVTGPIYPNWRDLSPQTQVTYANTVFFFDGIFDLRTVSKFNPNSVFTDSNVTYTRGILPEGNPFWISMSGESIQLTLERNEEAYGIVNSNIYSDDPQEWEVVEASGPKRVLIPASTSPDGETTTKSEELHLLHVDRRLATVWTVLTIEEETDAVLKEIVNGEVVKTTPAERTNVFNPQRHLVMRIGDRFVWEEDDDYIRGISPTVFAEKADGLITVPPEWETYDADRFLNDNPDFDSSSPTISPSAFLADRVPGAANTSVHRYCGRNDVQDTLGEGVGLRKNITAFALNFASISETAVSYWVLHLGDDRGQVVSNLTLPDGTPFLLGLAGVESLIETFNEMWFEVGCIHPLVNFQSTYSSVDYFREWLFIAFGESPAATRFEELSFSGVRESMRLLQSLSRVLQCGNCVLQSQGSGSYAASSSPYQCDPAYGTQLYNPPPTRRTLNAILSTSLPFCLAAGPYEIEFDHETGTIRMRLRPSQGTIQAIFRTEVAERLGQFSATHTCPPIFALKKSGIQVGFVELEMSNPEAFPVQIEVRRRTSPEDLALPPAAGGGCPRNFLTTIPAEVNITRISVPLCTDQFDDDVWYGIYNLAGQLCGGPFQASVEYSVPYNDTIQTVYTELYRNTSTFSIIKGLEDEIIRGIEEVKAEINTTRFEFTNKIIQFESGIAQMRNSFDFIRNLLRSTSEALETLRGQINLDDLNYRIRNITVEELLTNNEAISEALTRIYNTTLFGQSVQYHLDNALREGVQTREILAVAFADLLEQFDLTFKDLQNSKQATIQIRDTVDYQNGVEYQSMVKNWEHISKEEANDRKSLLYAVIGLGCVTGLLLIFEVAKCIYDCKKDRSDSGKPHDQ